MIDLVDNEVRHIAMLYRQLLRQLDRELSPIGLGPGRYAYLFALYIEDGRTQQALADAVGSDKAAAARALARLETDGYIRRAADPLDRRQVRAYLSAKGRGQRAQLERAAANALAALTSGLRDTEREQLRKLLRKMSTPLLNNTAQVPR